MKNQLFCFIIFLTYCISAHSQCDIQNIQTTSFSCDGEVYNVELSFEIGVMPSDSFGVQFNSTLLHTFAYVDLPVQILSLQTNCDTPDSLVILDSSDNTCHTDILIANNCCSDECQMDIDYIVNLDCSGDQGVQARLNLTPDSGFSELFDVYQDDVLIETAAYSDLPLDLVLNDDEFTSDIVVCDYLNTTCCDTLIHASTCTCAIFDIQYSLSECTDSAFMLSLDFEYFMVSDSFELGGNGMSYGTFAYTDLPVTIGPLYFDSLDYEIVIFEQLNAFCFNFIDLGVVENCFNECALGGLVAQASECNDQGNFTITFDFDQENILGESFLVFVNNELIDTLSYINSIYEVGPFPGDCATDYRIFLTDVFDNSCTSNLGLIGEICCDNVPQCTISNFIVNPEECQMNDSFYVSFAFEVNNPSSDSFSLFVNNDFQQTYGYADTAFQAGPFIGDCATLFEFNIQDQTNSVCQSTFVFNEPICCENNDTCSISNINYDITECADDSTFYIELFFDQEGTESDFFNFYVNSLLFDSIPYHLDSYSIGPLLGDCQTLYTFSIIDGLDSLCSAFFNLDDVICCDDPSPCSITEFIVNAASCEGQLFDIQFQFDSPNDSVDSFELVFNEISIDTFVYGDSSYTAGPFLGDCTTNYRFQLKDLNDPMCFSNLALLGVVCCEDETECVLSGLNFEISDCDINDQFSLILDFDYNSLASTEYIVNINDVFIDTGTYLNLPDTLTGLESICDSNTFIVIHDLLDTTCTLNFIIENPVCCAQDSCQLGAINIIDFRCINDLPRLEYDFNYTGTSSNYTIAVDGEILFSQPYIIGPQSITLPIFNDKDSILVQFCDQLDTLCCSDVYLSQAACYADCAFDNISIDYLDCDSIFYDVLLNVDFLSDTIAIDILLDSMYYGEFTPNDFPLQVGQFLGDSLNQHEISLINTSTLCSQSFVFDGINCLPSSNTNQFIEAVPFSIVNGILKLSDTVPFDHIQIFDIQGQKCASVRGKQTDLNKLTTGIYLVQLVIQKQVKTYKIFIN